MTFIKKILFNDPWEMALISHMWLWFEIYVENRMGKINQISHSDNIKPKQECII